MLFKASLALGQADMLLEGVVSGLSLQDCVNVLLACFVFSFFLVTQLVCKSVRGQYVQEKHDAQLNKAGFSSLRLYAVSSIIRRSHLSGFNKIY